MSQAKSIVSLINSDAMKQQFTKAMNSPKMIDKFLRLATSAINQTPNLADCSTASIVGALLKSAQLSLEPNTILGECYLIPRRMKGKWEANFEMGYKGIIKLAYRSGDVKIVQAYEVHENDLFDVDYGENKLVHKPELKGPRGEVIAYWARFILKDGTSDFRVWTKRDVEEHRDQYSKSATSDFSPWNTAFDQMAKKTVIKDVLRYAPLSVEDYAHAIQADATVINGEVPAGYVGSKVSTADLLIAPIGGEETAEPAEEPVPSPVVIKAVTGNGNSLFDKVEERIASRIKNGANPVDLEEKIGMSLDSVASLDEIELLKIYEKLK